jgi:murein L,D-transpeptidase YafK
MIRIFKRESELEVWMLKDDRFQLYALHRICYWSGRLGPKEREGDRQAPEGFYAVGLGQLHHVGRHPRSLNIGFPNQFDRAAGRTGSYILVHGGCTSVGCFAMTDAVMEQIYAVSEQALFAGQESIQIQIFPFRMSDENLATQTGNKWYPFWTNLRQGYDAFESTRMPPNVGVCRRSYVITTQTDHQQSAIDACSEEQAIASAAPVSRMLAAKSLSTSKRAKHMAASRTAHRAATSRSVRATIKGRSRRAAHAGSVSG